MISPLFQDPSKVWEGMKITLIGMGMVFLVLSILSIAIYLVGQSIYRAIKRKERREKLKEEIRPVREEKILEREEEVAAIAASIAAYLYLKARAPERAKRKEERRKDLWILASRLEAIRPDLEITRENLDEKLVEEGIRL